MPEGVRYLSKELPLPPVGLSLEDQVKELRQQVSDRLKHMYVQEGVAGAGSGGAVGDVFLIPLLVTADRTLSQGDLAAINPAAALNHPIYVAIIQDKIGGHEIQWNATEFVGVSTVGVGSASDEWSVDSGPDRVTVYHFVRHPTTNLWWLASWISYRNPDAEAEA